MDHPLIGNLDDLTTEELSSKVTELHKKLAIAYGLGNHHLCNQIRLAISTYQTKYQEKLRDSQKGTDFDNMIDIS